MQALALRHGASLGGLDSKRLSSPHEIFLLSGPHRYQPLEISTHCLRTSPRGPDGPSPAGGMRLSPCPDVCRLLDRWTSCLTCHPRAFVGLPSAYQMPLSPYPYRCRLLEISTHYLPLSPWGPDGPSPARDMRLSPCPDLCRLWESSTECLRSSPWGLCVTITRPHHASFAVI